MNFWKVILATVVIFGAGVITGGLLVRSSPNLRPIRAGHPAGSRGNQPMSIGGMRLEFLRRAQRELDLSTGQREQADKLIGDSQERIKKVLEPVNPVIRDDLQKTKQAFRELLTPEQRARFDELLKQQQQKYREQHHGSGSRERQSSPASTNAPTAQGQ